MSKVIEMYRTDQYHSWKDAEDCGGIYNVTVHNDVSIGDVQGAIYIACEMMDRAFAITTRTRDEYSEEFKLFYEAFDESFAYEISDSDAYAYIYCGTDGGSNSTFTRDAWDLWNKARKEFK